MATRGYKVYRWKGWYFVYYNPRDSCPSGLGVQFLTTIPKGAESFQKWLKKMRLYFDIMIKAHKKDEVNEEELTLTITEERPTNSILIEWVYEIDLDRLVFHVNSHPLFRLEHLPNNDLFLKCIGFDHYGNGAYTSSTPPEYRYHWDAPPPIVADAALELYKSPAGNSAAINDLLSVSVLMNDQEKVRVRVLQVIVGNLMRSVGRVVRELTQVPDHNCLSNPERSLAWYLLDIAIDPQVFPDDPTTQYNTCHSRTMWRRQNICVHLTTHLDDQRNMQAAVAGLIADTMQRPFNTRGIIYGIAFSIFHCVIVRIDTQNGFKFQHSEALQFLPSFYADSASTPGITALARLGYHADAEVIMKVACSIEYSSDSVRKKHILNSLQFMKPMTRQDIILGHIEGVLKPPGGGRIGRLLPQEMWEHVALYLYDPKDLLVLAWFSAESRTAAENALRRSMTGGYRLVRVLDSDKGKRTKDDHSHLYFARFEVISAASHGVMVLEAIRRSRRDRRMGLPSFEYMRFEPIQYVVDGNEKSPGEDSWCGMEDVEA